MAEPLIVQGASKGTSCSLLRAMTLTDALLATMISWMNFIP